MTDAEYEALIAAQSILGLLFYRHAGAIEEIGEEYPALMLDALRKVSQLTEAEDRRRRDTAGTSA